MESAYVERGRKLIDCEKCYRLRYCGDNIYYCAFAGLNPCIRGEHTPWTNKAAKATRLESDNAEVEENSKLANE